MDLPGNQAVPLPPSGHPGRIQWQPRRPRALKRAWGPAVRRERPPAGVETLRPSTAAPSWLSFYSAPATKAPRATATAARRRNLSCSSLPLHGVVGRELPLMVGSGRAAEQIAVQRATLEPNFST